jgi:2-oxoisovalerate dehydrogenase E1 component
MAQNITEMAFDYLDAPPVVVGSRNWITPPFEMEEYFFPQESWIIDAIHERILPLKGHTNNLDFTSKSKNNKSKLGV